jgi:2-keto-4-pentenoate hydratase/2-oxohepta-3-ene-1,7-dioic acid hydratase in catechol pathway
MRLARIAHPDGVAFVAIDGPDGSEQRAREIADHPFGSPAFTGKSWPLADVRLLAPILPSKILALGRNYRDHAAELGNPVPTSPMLFMKPSTSVIGPGAAIRLPASSNRIDYEGELAAVIGKPCRDVKAEDAASVILGYTVANDVTARDQQKADGQFTRAKSYDTFCPLGPWIETELDPAELRVTTELDDQLVQDGSTADMVFSTAEFLEYVTGIMTLLPGDVLLTGTPAGVGPMVDGQTISITVEGIGTLTNPIRAR